MDDGCKYDRLQCHSLRMWSQGGLVASSALEDELLHVQAYVRVGKQERSECAKVSRDDHALEEVYPATEKPGFAYEGCVHQSIILTIEVVDDHVAQFWWKSCVHCEHD